MRVIGLTGGVGSGKSLAAQILQEECKAELLIADNLGHVAMEQGTSGYGQIIDRFGTKILLPDGSIDRNALAQEVFQEEQARHDLNQIIHPVVKAYIRDYIAERKAQEGIIILETAILFESGCEEFCDEIWYVHVSENVRRERLSADRGYSEEKTTAIMSKQLAEEEFYRRCQVVVENDGTIEELRENIRRKIRERYLEKNKEKDNKE